jgi:adenylosuccinate synthase
LIHVQTLLEEYTRYAHLLRGKRILIHPHAAIVLDEHAIIEKESGQTKMGSTAKGVGAAMIQRIERGATRATNIAANDKRLRDFGNWVVTAEEYRQEMDKSQSILIEGAQGFSLSMYHGFYPYTTSRDVTVWQIAADCGIPTKWMNYLHVIGTLRTFPIRVNNRDGSSGPGYPDQKEISWDQIGVEPELTTVTKLPRRLFTFSQQQLTEAMWHNGGYWQTSLFLNFCNYLGWPETYKLISQIETARPLMLNPPKVVWTGWGPDHDDISNFAEQAVI